MQSSIVSISETLNKYSKFTTVGFSGGYTFDEIKAADYFDNLLLNAESAPIFSGILLMENSGDFITIIDGAQRITTIVLLLSAICSIYKGSSVKNEDSRNKILDRFLLFNGQPRLFLKDLDDNEILKKIILAQELNQSEKSNNLYMAYNIFVKKIKENKISANKLFKIISTIEFMIVITDKTNISLRDFYQVLNNKQESQINLIKDFVSQQGVAVAGLWHKTSVLLGESQVLEESFIRDFLVTRVDEPVMDKSRLYNSFKSYFYNISKYQDSKEIFENIYKYAQYYQKIIKADFENEEIKEQIRILNKNNGRDTYPYLMEVLDDLENLHIDESAFINILMMVNLFIKSRDELSIQNVNIDFANLSKELNKMLVLKDYVPEILYENKLTINEINNLSKFEV